MGGFRDLLALMLGWKSSAVTTSKQPLDFILYINTLEDMVDAYIQTSKTYNLER